MGIRREVRFRKSSPITSPDGQQFIIKIVTRIVQYATAVG